METSPSDADADATTLEMGGALLRPGRPMVAGANACAWFAARATSAGKIRRRLNNMIYYLVQSKGCWLVGRNSELR